MIINYKCIATQDLDNTVIPQISMVCSCPHLHLPVRVPREGLRWIRGQSIRISCLCRVYCDRLCGPCCILLVLIVLIAIVYLLAYFCIVVIIVIRAVIVINVIVNTGCLLSYGCCACYVNINSCATLCQYRCIYHVRYGIHRIVYPSSNRVSIVLSIIASSDMLSKCLLYLVICYCSIIHNGIMISMYSDANECLIPNNL